VTSARQDDLGKRFVAMYDRTYKLMFSKQKEVTAPVELPATLLCVRVVTESIFRICYPQWWQTKYGEILADRIDELITFLFDPLRFHSHLVPL
jgi:hypothetical protein